MAKEADWGICLARTNPTAPKHLGITYFIVDMATPGLDIRPLREMTGMAMFNEVFFDDVFVPDDCLVGEVDGGWPLARTTLANERVSMGSGSSFGGGIEALVGLVAERLASGALTADALLLDELGALRGRGALAGRAGPAHDGALGHRRRARVRRPACASCSAWSTTSARRSSAWPCSAPRAPPPMGAAAQWTFGFLANRCLTIAGGTSEIQRNVIGERLLGLPRDPEPAG